MLPGIDVCLAWAQRCASSPKLSFNPHFTDVETEPRGAWVTCWRSCNSCQLVSAFRSVCLQSPRARNCSSVGQEFIFPVTGTALGSKPSFYSLHWEKPLHLHLVTHLLALWTMCYKRNSDQGSGSPLQAGWALPQWRPRALSVRARQSRAFRSLFSVLFMFLCSVLLPWVLNSSSSSYYTLTIFPPLPNTWFSIHVNEKTKWLD